MEDYVKREWVIELVSKYYDKFKYESDADELLTDLEHMKGLELTRCKDCENYEVCFAFGECNLLCSSEDMYTGA